jgi:hypothetical protein
MKARTLREVAIYREVDSPFEVSRDSALAVIEPVFARISRAVGGQVVTSSVRGIRIKYESDALVTTKVRIPTDAAHSIMFTKRPLLSGGVEADGIARKKSLADTWMTGSQIISRILDAQVDPYGITQTATGLHEVGHTFGLDHCADKCCVMSPVSESATTVNDTLRARIEQPFCDDRLDDLELAGMAALAVRL